MTNPSAGAGMSASTVVTMVVGGVLFVGTIFGVVKAHNGSDPGRVPAPATSPAYGTPGTP